MNILLASTFYARIYAPHTHKNSVRGSFGKKHVYEILSHYVYIIKEVLSEPYLQQVLVQDMAYHLVDGGSHMQLEHPSLHKTNGKLNVHSSFRRSKNCNKTYNLATRHCLV
jgi:hypothetical protein